MFKPTSNGESIFLSCPSLLLKPFLLFQPSLEEFPPSELDTPEPSSFAELPHSLLEFPHPSLELFQPLLIWLSELLLLLELVTNSLLYQINEK